MRGAEFDQIGEIANAPRQPVELRDDDTLDLAAPYSFEEFADSWPFEALGALSGVSGEL